MPLLIGLPSLTEWMLILLAFGVILVVPKVFYLITLQSTLQSIAPANRRIPPINVWLLLIPFFSLVYNFIIIGKMADSIKAEMEARNAVVTESRPAYDIGLALCILNLVCFVPGLNIFAGIAALVCWIIYWVRISTYKSQIMQPIIV